MSNESPALVQKIWNYCDVLRDGGISYGEYVDQLTNLLFLKIQDEQEKPPINEKRIIPKECGWSTLLTKRGSDLQNQYEKILRTLSKKSGLLGLIYKDSTNKIKKPADLERLIHDMDNESWASLDLDVKGEIYEGLLEKHSNEVKGGAGQYFTPRALIQAIVTVIDPKPDERVCDPSCGTGGFFLEARKHITNKYSPLNPTQRRHLDTDTFYGNDITPSIVKLCAMNMYLHHLATTEDQIQEADSLQKPSDMLFDVIMTNPPFGSAKSFITNNNGAREKKTYERDDFWTTGTGDKYLNFLQHAYTSLRVDGRCAIVLPDAVLFQSTNAHKKVREKMLQHCNVHTILRLPTGIFYANGVKANVIFFEKKRHRQDGKPWTTNVWFYDLRTNISFTQKENKMERVHLDDFVKCYMAKKRQDSERFKRYTREDLIARESWDIRWLKDNSDVDMSELPSPKTLVRKIVQEMSVINRSIKRLEKEFG